jgi:hypothetical protein
MLSGNEWTPRVHESGDLSVVSGHSLIASVWLRWPFLTVGDERRKFEGGDTWTAAVDWTLRECVRSCLTGASGRLEQQTVRGPTALSGLAPYLSVLAGPSLSLLLLWHTWHPYELRQIPFTHLYYWFIIIVRLEVIPSVFTRVIASSGTWRSLWLRIFFVSLGGCRHLDGLE